MIPVLYETAVSQPATGQERWWLNEEASPTGSASFFELVYTHPSLNGLPSLAAYSIELTDPAAGFRFKQPELLAWMSDLRKLDAVSQMVIPDMRPLTPAEQRNLRGIYKKLYRRA